MYKLQLCIALMIPINLYCNDDSYCNRKNILCEYVRIGFHNCVHCNKMYRVAIAFIYCIYVFVWLYCRHVLCTRYHVLEIMFWCAITILHWLSDCYYCIVIISCCSGYFLRVLQHMCCIWVLMLYCNNVEYQKSVVLYNVVMLQLRNMYFNHVLNRKRNYVLHARFCFH